MAGRVETGQNPDGAFLSEEQRELVTSHALAIHSVFDAKIMAKIGFGGSILDEVRRARTGSVSLTPPLDVYQIRATRTSVYIDSKPKEEKFSYSIRNDEEHPDRLKVRLSFQGTELKLLFNPGNELIFWEANAEDKKAKIKPNKQFPFELERSCGGLSISGEYHNLDEGGNFELATGGKIKATFGNQFDSYNNTAEGLYMSDVREIDWNGLWPIVELDKGNILISEDYGSKPLALPLRANMHDELQIV